MLTLDEIVTMDDEQSRFLPWNKLNKSLKLKRIMEFADELSSKEDLSPERQGQLKQMLKDKLDLKCLQRFKDVNYDHTSERILSIPALHYSNNKYTLKSEVVSPLASLAPKNKTVRHKN